MPLAQEDYCTIILISASVTLVVLMIYQNYTEKSRCSEEFKSCPPTVTCKTNGAICQKVTSMPNNKCRVQKGECISAGGVLACSYGPAETVNAQ
jgi:hypothetical protein